MYVYYIWASIGNAHHIRETKHRRTYSSTNIVAVAGIGTCSHNKMKHTEHTQSSNISSGLQWRAKLFFWLKCLTAEYIPKLHHITQRMWVYATPLMHTSLVDVLWLFFIFISVVSLPLFFVGVLFYLCYLFVGLSHFFNLASSREKPHTTHITVHRTTFIPPECEIIFQELPTYSNCNREENAVTTPRTHWCNGNVVS